jgi:hypothetical protein
MQSLISARRLSSSNLVTGSSKDLVDTYFVKLAGSPGRQCVPTSNNPWRIVVNHLGPHRKQKLSGVRVVAVNQLFLLTYH